MDKIFLHGMQAQTVIGIYDWERLHPQTILLDLDIVLPHCVDSDDIDTTIHYGQVCDYLRQDLATRQFLLIERLAQHIADTVLQNFGAQSVKVRVMKLGILPKVQEVGVEIERHKVA